MHSRLGDQAVQLSVEEPLAESAPLAWKLALQTCRKDADGISCTWNHGLWQYLRLLGLVTSPSHQADFYHSALSRAAKPSPRVLISGAADYSMLAVVLAVFGARAPGPQVTVLDACETPLALSRWYAERARVTIETVAADIRDYASDNSFDIVCSDNFFGRFPSAERPAVAARWASLLRSGGIAVTINRLRPESEAARVSFSAAQAAAFRGAVYQAARATPAVAAFAEELAGSAEVYAERHFTYPMHSVEELRRDFEAAGLAVEYVGTASAAGGNRQASSGPSVRGFQSYARLVARRA